MYLFKGKVVAGYDRTPTPLTETLISEGAQIHYEENVDLIPAACKDKESTLVIYTPAEPEVHKTVDMFEDDQELKEQARIARLKKEEEEREAKLAAKEAEKLRKQKEKEEKERRKREAGPSWIQRKIDSLTKEIFSDDDMK